MDCRQGTPYPYHEMESNIVSSCEEKRLTFQFKAHNFDKFPRTTKNVSSAIHQLEVFIIQNMESVLYMVNIIKLIRVRYLYVQN